MDVAPKAFGVRPGPTSPATTAQLTFFGGPRRLGAAVTTCEFLDPAGGIDEFLFAGEKRMTSSTNADFNIVPRRAGMIHRATRANDVGLVILWMNACFHVRKLSAESNRGRRLRKQ